MDNQQQYIQKRLLFKSQKNINTVFKQYFRLLSGQPTIIPKEEIIKSIEQLQFQNFKYRMALLSAQKDQYGNQTSLTQIGNRSLIFVEKNIQHTKRQIKQQSDNLQKVIVSKRNKSTFNDLAKVIQQYDKKQQIANKIETINREIEQAQTKLNEQKKIREYKQRCLYTSLSALKGFLSKEKIRQKDGQILDF